MKGLKSLKEKIETWPGARWLFLLLCAATALFLGLSLETGRLHAQVAGFRFRGALVRVITPNGDAHNPQAILCFENPRDSAVNGKVFDLRGQEVSGMVLVKDAGQTHAMIVSCRAKYPPSVTPQQTEALTWDGTSGGARAASGVYLFQVQAEDASVTGTLVVVR